MTERVTGESSYTTNVQEAKILTMGGTCRCNNGHSFGCPPYKCPFCPGEAVVKSIEIAD